MATYLITYKSNPGVEHRVELSDAEYKFLTTKHRNEKTDVATCVKVL